MTTSFPTIAPGVTTNEQLSSTDYDYIDLTNGYAYDVYQLTKFTPGVPVTIELNGTFDTFLHVENEAGDIIAYDSNSGSGGTLGGTNSKLQFTPVLGDNYLIGVSNEFPNNYGSYQLEVSS